MPAVVYEQIDLSELSKEFPDAAPAGSADVRPAITKALGHGRADLRMQISVTRRRKVDAPEMTSPVLRQSFEDEARCDATSDARLNHLGRPQMARETPDSPHQPRLAVPPATEGATSQLEALLFERVHHRRPHFPELVGIGAGPRRARELVDVLLPVLVDVIWAWRPGHESTDSICPRRPCLLTLRDLRVDVEDALDGVPQESANQTPSLAQLPWPSVRSKTS